MKMKKNERLGQEFVNKHGCVFKIIEYNSTKDVVVEFQDEFKHKQHTQYHVCLKGEVFNPFYRSVYGVGYLGVTKTKYSKREYHLWYDMIERCYSDKYPTYKDCIVCERWHCFSNFLEDITQIPGYTYWKENPKKRIALDKDVRGKNTRVYSLKNCCFLSCSDNTKERLKRVPVSTQELVSVDIKTGQVYYYESTMDAERDGFNRAGIWNCCQGKYSQHKGRKWFYKEQYEELI